MKKSFKILNSKNKESVKGGCHSVYLSQMFIDEKTNPLSKFVEIGASRNTSQGGGASNGNGCEIILINL